MKIRTEEDLSRLFCRVGGRAERVSDHLPVCEAYSSLREEMDPELVRRDREMYLRQVIKVREALESKLK